MARRKADAPTNKWINRELSLIAFNRRVLAQAQDISLPLLERVKFLAIVSSNLDEFFMVRMAGLLRHQHDHEGSTAPGPDAMPLGKLVEEARTQSFALLAEANRCWLEDVGPALRDSNIILCGPDEIRPTDRTALRTLFRDEILPVLTPMVVDPTHPFPLLTSGSVYILLRVRPRPDPDSRFFSKADTILVQVPGGLPRLTTLPSTGDARRFILLEDVVAMFAHEIVNGYDVLQAHHFRVLRDAELPLGDEDPADDWMNTIQKGLKRSRRGAPVRLTVGSRVPDEEAEYLCRALGLKRKYVFRAEAMLDMKCLFGLPGLADRPDLLEQPWPPLDHPAFAGAADMFEVLRQKDVFVSLPYYSFDPVTRFIESAADDPSVLAVKITLYRVSGQSPIVRALIRAAEQGKQVTALVEIQARFDEEANITWARRLDAAGAHVIYGVVGYKTHSKAALIIRREPDGIRRYCHLATGNYNDRTARQYTDLGILTADPDIGSDVSAFFNVITGYSLPPAWKLIEMAPTGLRTRTIAMIRREVAKHTRENPGCIRAKMNALIDPEIIQELYAASQAGVRIQLLVRGMCRLRPGVPGLSENITVRSIVDRYLEHPRIFQYHNGGDEEIYLSSADWMERNMDRRLELLFPVRDPDCRQEIMQILDAGFADNVSAWTLGPDEKYVRCSPAAAEPICRSQQLLYQQAAAKVAASRRSKKRGVFQARTASRSIKTKE